MFSGVGNLRCTYDLHQTFFSLTLPDMSLEEYYGRFRLVCEEIRLSGPISSDIAAMEWQRESMWVTRFLFGLPSFFDGARSQILGAKEVPSLSEVFSRLCQDTLPFVAPSPTNRSALAAFVRSSCSFGPYRSLTVDLIVLAALSS